jgi:glucosylceramidase
MAVPAALAAAAAVGVDISVVQSNATAGWIALTGLSWEPDFPADVALEVNGSAVQQEILGFGGALTDTTAWNVMVGMNSSLRESFLSAYFDSSVGLGYSLARITLNSADYSVESFNYDNVTGDLSLEHFDETLAYDNQRVIPLIRAANATASSRGNGPLRLFASPWSPPGWMKTNLNMINSDIPCLIGGPTSSYAATWSAYVVRWLSAMQAQGISFWGLTPQNEPLARQSKFESCYWSGDDMLSWLTGFLGPAVKAAFPNLRFMLYDHNKLASYNWSLPILTNASALAYIDGVALHWYDYDKSLGLEEVAAIQALPFYAQPGPSGTPRFMLNTEACYLQSLELNWTQARRDLGT